MAAVYQPELLALAGDLECARAADENEMMVSGRSSSKRGVLLGQVVQDRGQRVALQLQTAFARGDRGTMDERRIPLAIL